MTRVSIVAAIVIFAACAAAQAERVRLNSFVAGMDQPLYLTHAGDGSKRLFVVEKNGRIVIIQSGKAVKPAFLDITAKTSRSSEQGLLGLAFSPDFKSSGRAFVNYTDKAGDTVVSEYRISADPDRLDPESEKVLLKVDQPYANHNGGNLEFGPDGMLYIGLGDGGAGGDPHGNGQKMDTLLGKMLRIDVSEPGKYKIPPDNPFAGKPGVRGEIWAYGLRNPWRYSFDSATGRLFAGDVGQNKFEEVHIVERGKNYGWNIMEAAHCFKPQNCERSGLELPIAEYGRDEGISITGGYVYRGKRVPELTGKYIFGDFGSGTIWTLTEQPDKSWRRELLLRKPIAISSFGEDAERELYVTDLAGGVYRFEK